MKTTLVFLLMAIALLSASLIHVYAEENEFEILFAEIGVTQYSGSLQMNTIKTAIYSEFQTPVVVTIYVQDSEMVPLGVMIFKTTLLAGVTPIEYGFTVPIECHYDSRIHEPVCSSDSSRTIYVNIFEDFALTMPLAPEYVYVGVWA